MTPRTRLSDELVAFLEQDFEANGIKCMQTLRRLNPSAYVRAAAAILIDDPAGDDFDGLSTEELEALLVELGARVSAP